MFRAQVDHLQQEGWQTVALRDLAKQPWTNLEKTMVITFDDGYRDNLAAFDLLASYGMTATLFMVSGAIGQKPAWLNTDSAAGSRILDAAELRAVRDMGIEVGSHTATHRRLTELQPVEIETQLADSKARLEAVLNEEVSSFAYPYGAWNWDCVRAVERVGYRAACTTAPGRALKDESPFLIRRLSVFNTDNLGSFSRKLVFASNDGSWQELLAYLRRRAVARLRVRN